MTRWAELRGSPYPDQWHLADIATERPLPPSLIAASNIVKSSETLPTREPLAPYDLA
jgi:hypothetical protein